jgi:hypothetical protein
VSYISTKFTRNITSRDKFLGFKKKIYPESKDKEDRYRIDDCSRESLVTAG